MNLDSGRSRIDQSGEEHTAHVLLLANAHDFADRGAYHAAYAAERYRRGLAEYPDGSDVGPGFLVPVLVGQFDPARPRLTWEQPLAAWVEELAAAGWTTGSTTMLDDYWWAPAHLILARS